MKGSSTPPILITLAMLGAVAGTGFGLSQKEPKKRDRPEFTEEELGYIRSLPKKQRAKAVEELLAKYRGME